MQPLPDPAGQDPTHARVADPAASLPHERILAVARELFCRDGIHATGIDRILTLAGASKMTLYSRFGSKEALVRVVLHEEGKAWRQRFFSALDASAPTPAGRLGHAVAVLGPWFRETGFTGCAFINAAAEHTKGESWIRDIAAGHHHLVLARLAGEAREAGASSPDLLARQILLILDGAMAAMMVGGDAAVLDASGHTLRAILGQHLPADA
ncbi:MAG: TetR/AcrR family transcriptional regulator [Janthinobacterium lividum]